MQKTNKSVLLIEPPFYRLFKETYSLDRYPLSLGYLSGTIMKETDWKVTAYNADFTPSSELIKVSYLANDGFSNYLNNLSDISHPIWKEVKATISEYKPTVVGISAKSQNFRSACMLAKLAKEVDERIIVIVGGPHSSMVGPAVLNYADIDISVKGEGEVTIVDLLQAIDGKKSLSDVNGICYKKHDRIIENSKRDFIKNLDSLCFPHENAAEVLKDFDKYPPSSFNYIFATRGCPYNCFFCGSRKIWSRRVRYRSCGSIIREIKSLKKRGLKSIHFADDTFGVTRERIKEISDAIRMQFPSIKWSCELPVKLIDGETIGNMKASGCHAVQIGIESGNNKILRKIRKNITIEEALHACEVVRRHGISLEVFFIVGFPYDTVDTLIDTINVMKSIRCDTLTYSIFTPYLGTESFQVCKQNGLVDDNFDVGLYNHQSPANCFSFHITPDDFRILANKVEKMVDRKNLKNRIRGIFCLKKKLQRMQDLGIRDSVRAGVRVLFNK